MVDDFDAMLAIWDKLIAKVSPTMMEDFDSILAIWDKLISKISLTMVNTLMHF